MKSLNETELDALTGGFAPLNQSYAPPSPPGGSMTLLLLLIGQGGTRNVSPRHISD